jgi:hypothetical protein
MLNICLFKTKAAQPKCPEIFDEKGSRIENVEIVPDAARVRIAGRISRCFEIFSDKQPCHFSPKNTYQCFWFGNNFV